MTDDLLEFVDNLNSDLFDGAAITEPLLNLEHIPFECTNLHTPEEKDASDCVYCDYKFVTCIACSMSEGELTTHCPGEKVGDVMKQMVLMGQADFINGEWIRPNLVRDLSFK